MLLLLFLLLSLIVVSEACTKRVKICLFQGSLLSLSNADFKRLTMFSEGDQSVFNSINKDLSFVSELTVFSIEGQRVLIDQFHIPHEFLSGVIFMRSYFP